MAPVLLLLAGISVVYVLLCLVQRYWKLRGIPGPYLASVTDFWRFRIQYFGPIFPTLVDLHRRYGTVVRIGPNKVSVSGAEHVKTIYTNRGEFKKADSYAPMRVYVDGKSVGSIIDMQDEDQNRALKRAVGGAFMLKNLVDYEDDVDATLGALIQRIRQNPTFNLYETLQLFQLDFLIKIAFSETPGHLQQGADVLGLAKLGNKRVSHWFSWHAMPTLERFIFHSPIWGRWLARPSKWARMGAERLQARQNVAIHISEHTDLLQKCIDASEKYPDLLRTQTVANLVNSIISAGADTTAGTMTTIFYFLLKNPAKCQRLLQELDEARLQGRLSIPPRYADVSGLSYLDAVIKEALRLNPPLAVPLERIVPEQGCFIDGLHIPGGTVIGCMAKIVHLDRTCYGPDAEKFRPERWLEAPKGQGITMERGFLSWGSGNRICLGRHIAELELKKVIPSLLLSFNMNLENPAMVMPFQEGIIEFDSNPIMATFGERVWVKSK